MQPKVVILSYPRLTPSFRRLIQQLPPGVSFEVADRLIDEAVAYARQLEQAGAVDVFVSSGANARVVREVVQAPLVTVQVQGLDLLQAIARAGEIDAEVAIAAYEDQWRELDDLLPLIVKPARRYSYRSMAEARTLTHELARRGHRALVGTSLTCDLAEQQGMRGILVYSDEAMLKALTAASDLALSLHREVCRRQELRAILDLTSEGIIAVDGQGRISTLNPAAERLLGVPARNALSRPAAEVLPGLGMDEVLSGGLPELNQVLRLGDIQLLINRIPIRDRGAIVGVVATFQDVGVVQQTESKIRRELYTKGFSARYTFDHIIGSSQPLCTAIDTARRYARTDSTVLIHGETGVGKELFAQAIHNAGSRRNRPFVPLNCAALPESLLESELFGYEEGAFTGARRGGKPGVFELAHGGTIFLDEISEISGSLQARLLRVLQERQVMRLGGVRVTPVDVRVLTATNRELAELVREGKFREDLYYRLDVLRLEIPPLRQRLEDLPALFQQAVRQLQPGRAPLVQPVLDAVAALLRGHDWPGNVRELENYTERVLALCEPHEQSEGFVALLQRTLPQAPGPAGGRLQQLQPAAASEWELIERALQEAGSLGEAARRLGVSRSTLWRRLKGRG